jgi:hypothetical protein
VQLARPATLLVFAVLVLRLVPKLEHDTIGRHWVAGEWIAILVASAKTAKARL